MSERNAVLNLIKSSLWGTPLDQTQFEGCDWHAVFREFHDQSITMLPADLLGELDVDEDVMAKWKHEIFSHYSHYTNCLNAQSEIAETFAETGIKWVVLKGTAASKYYDKPQYRILGDIDILVEPNEIDTAKTILESIGYVFKGEVLSGGRHLNAEKNGIELELHRYFAPTLDQGKDKKLNNLVFNGLEKAVICEIDGIEFPTLLDVANGIVLIRHICQHLKSGLGLRQVIDFIMYVDKVLDDKFWNESFGAVARELGFETVSKVVARIGQLYLGLDNSIEWCKDADTSLCSELFELVLAQGNMGRKSDESSNTTITALNSGRGGFINRFKFEQQSGMVHWKAAQKHSVLRPFAWIYGIGHHIRKLAEIDKPVASLIKNSKESARQVELMEKLEIK